uniref:Uncharacterized protein n=1 Tax=Trichuris muris TaxID=70415 RepID=A0A5S6QCL7_TRIMR
MTRSRCGLTSWGAVEVAAVLRSRAGRKENARATTVCQRALQPIRYLLVVRELSAGQSSSLTIPKSHPRFGRSHCNRLLTSGKPVWQGNGVTRFPDNPANCNNPETMRQAIECLSTNRRGAT